MVLDPESIGREPPLSLEDRRTLKDIEFEIDTLLWDQLPGQASYTIFVIELGHLLDDAERLSVHIISLYSRRYEVRFGPEDTGIRHDESGESRAVYFQAFVFTPRRVIPSAPATPSSE